MRSHTRARNRVRLFVTAPAKHVWAALLVVYVVWGSTYFGIKIAVETIPPLLAAGSRFLVAGLLLAAWIVAANGAEKLRLGIRQVLVAVDIEPFVADGRQARSKCLFQ